MPQTYEELIAARIDDLYAGALFLTGGAADAAEELVLDTVRHSFRNFRGSERRETPFHRWMEGLLVGRFIDRRGAAEEPIEEPDRTDLPDGGVDRLRNVTKRDLQRAASGLPATVRAALWLVVLKRWGYGETAEALGVDRARLEQLLSYRSVLLRRVVTVGEGRDDGGDAAGVR